ncbi:serine/threonine-protein phosphatase 6 regulatory subunit 2 isoform X2 [Neocloeon triangulifer]|uniref:serine/threonine-protein phosphatase 6 regulatory subunit 2 isoform X2 n=1 Tax=Neocloeon triangulifer TaxID=2078957 RepID=UPI00286F5735|nr:serine/threonine-protein phosphatase 6 regulatory subunit 2 isoform X2 [Neocloeon triangulifer]
MFWKYNASACSHLETLLSKEDVTLYEVLDEEDIVQECRVQNKKLIDYLLRPEILEQLVSLTVEEPSIEVEEKHRFRYSNMACELLTCDVPQLNERLAGSETLLTKLYSFLDTPPPLNPLLASFFSKTFTGLVTRRAEQALEFLKKQEDTVGVLLRHLGTSAIMDFLQRLITSVEGNDMRKNVLTWLEGQNVVQRILELMGPETEPERHCNASQLLLDVIRISRDTFRTCSSENGGPDPILERLESPETASTILDLMLSGGDQRSESAIVGGVAVLLTLLETSRLPSDDGSEHNEERELSCQSNICKAMVPRLKDLHDVLLHPPKKSAIQTTAEHLDPPFGNTRLQVCRLISALVATQDVEVLTTLSELGTLSVLLDLFFAYKWNNFLHSQVEHCITLLLQSLSGPEIASLNHNFDKTFAKSPGSSPSTPPAEAEADSGDSEKKDEVAETEENVNAPHISEPSPLVINLFGESRLLERVIEAYKKDKDGSLPKVKCGYFGHLVLICNCIRQCVTEETLARLVPAEDTRLEWHELLDGQIEEINKIQSEFLGGQHPSKIIESEDNDYPIIPFSQEGTVLLNFTELLTCYKSTPFAEGSSYDDNQFFDNEDPMHSEPDTYVPPGYRLGSSDEMSRRRELFFDMCNQKTGPGNDDDLDNELNFNSPTTVEPPVVRNLSDDSDEEEQSNVPGAGVMEIDTVDPWADTPAVVADAENPWEASEIAAAEQAPVADQDGWANFCAFSSGPEAAPEVKDEENNAGSEAADQTSADTNANPPLETLEENSELVDNFRFLSQGLMSAEGVAVDPPATQSDTPLAEAEEPKCEETEVVTDSGSCSTNIAAEGEGSI